MVLKKTDIMELSMEDLIAKGKKLCSLCDFGPVEKSHNSLMKVLSKFKASGSTALGPALAIAAGVLSGSASSVGSRVVLCTDGMSTDGVGKVDLFLLLLLFVFLNGL